VVNDYNDRAIREGVKYFDSILSSSENENCKAILITNDMANSVRLSPLSPSLPLHDIFLILTLLVRPVHERTSSPLTLSSPMSTSISTNIQSSSISSPMRYLARTISCLRSKLRHLLSSMRLAHVLTHQLCSREALFPSHLSVEAMTKGIKNKKYYRGVLRCRGGGRLGYDDCYLVVHQETNVNGKKKVNRWSISLKGVSSILCCDGTV
jgi:hypothetical protein